MADKNTKRQYFVDEAGDGNLFGKRGNVIIGQEGCSKYFMLGVLDIPDPVALANEMNTLRQQLLSDPYFKKVPSMQPEAQKTYLVFHAKDDVPEVRREVFAVIRKYELRFLAVVRNKSKVLQYVYQRNSQDPTYHYHPNELYDYMVRVLFKNLLHKDQEYDITFSKRGQQDRTVSLKNALECAQKRFSDQWKIENSSIVNIYPKTPVVCISLQVVDYFLWSLQRFYELHEDRYLELLWPSYRLVHDLDDTRTAKYGCYYTQKRPLTLAVLDNSLPGI
ncbi:MAG: DUF3800 domain-containing protein [Anaerolineaceae bacterium]